MLYGTRTSSHILSEDFNFTTAFERPPAFLDSDIDNMSTEVLSEKPRPFMDQFIIAHDNKIKSKFDAWVMLLVTYSCIISLYNSAFEPLSQRYYPEMLIIDWTIEIFFYLDLITAFLHGYYDEEENIAVDDFETVHKKYLNSWFAIDFFAVFPFQVFFSGGFALKLVRLMRLPRLFKLLSV